MPITSKLLVGLIALLTAVPTHAMAAAPAADMGDFHPIKEADMPKGFPPYTRVGELEVKEYPAYRRATASGTAEFWKLFSHIKKNNVEMTAPVEMNYGDPLAGKLREQSMSFLYERPDQGATGKQADVEVADVPPMKVVSLGCRGRRSPKALEDAQKRLLKWLDEHKAEYVADGQLRVMGYNSPFVPEDKNFFEVQVPIKAVMSK